VWHLRAHCGCLQSIFKYCKCKINMAGCCPDIGYVGASSASSSSGFPIYCNLARNNQPARLVYGVWGPWALPFAGGTLCVKGPTFGSWVGWPKLAPIVNSGGNSVPIDCSGHPAIDFNAFAAGALGGGPLPALQVPGTTVWCQWFMLDPGNTFNLAMSDALQFTIGP
jgi:hypothetical protein